MKKIGIITFHRACNYGAILQCYALQQCLSKWGYEAKVIDYIQPYTESIYKSLGWAKIREYLFHPRGLFKYILKYNVRAKRLEIFNDFALHYLNLTSCCSAKTLPADFDIYIIGSDQLWNISCLGGKIDNVYMGNIQHFSTSKIVSYAISTDVKSLDFIGKIKLKQYVDNFECLSFREKSMAEKVASMTEQKCRVDIDPTLLADAKMWNDLVDNKWSDRKYIVVYQVRYPRGKKNILIEKAKAIAKQLNNYQIIDLSESVYSPRDFISLIKYASCVITSSFHATVFSLIFEIPFYTLRWNDGSDLRYTELLATLGLNNRLIDLNSNISFSEINYTPINKKLAEIRRPSINYLLSL